MNWAKEKAYALWVWLQDNKAIWFAVFVIVYAVAWTLNAVAQTKFVLKEWEELGKYVLGKYGTDSLLNTPIPGIQRGDNK